MCTKVFHPLRLLLRLCPKVRSIFHDHNKETIGLAQSFLIHLVHLLT